MNSRHESTNAVAAVASALPEGAIEWVAAHAPRPIERLQLIADSSRSVVVRIEIEPLAPSDDVAPPATESLFLKVDRILPPAEAAILARLAPRWPAHIAQPLALEEERGWSLTRDVGPHGLGDASTAEWCRVVDRFARIQQDTGLAPEDWIALGCRDRRGDRLHAAFEGLLDDCWSELDEADRRSLDGLRPRIAEACDVLVSDGIPAALVHQDIVPVNVVLREPSGRRLDGLSPSPSQDPPDHPVRPDQPDQPQREPVFLDWSDTVVCHPFFGCDRLLDSCWSDAERKAAVIAAYLAAFEGVAPAERLSASFQRVLQLRVLWEGVRWRDEIAAMDPEDEAAVRLRADQLLGLRMMADFARKQGLVS